MLGIVSMLSAWAVVAGATSAAAHVPDGSATCDGVIASGTDYDNKDTNTYSISLDGVVQRSGTFNKKFDEKVPVPEDAVTHAWSVSITSSGDPDGTKGWTKSFSGLVGPCDSTPEAEKISFCHYPADLHRGLQTVSKNAFFVSGHIDHLKDIYPAGSIRKRGVTFSWPAQGDQSLLKTDCAAPSPIEVAVPATPQVTDPCGVGNAAWVVPADGGHITWKLTAGDLVASTDAGYTFPGGATSHDFGQAVETNVAACPIEVAVPATPQVTDPCGVGNAAWVVPADGGNITWKLTAGDLVASTDAGYTFPGGKTSHDFGQAVETNVAACPVVAAAVGVAAPVLTGPTCTAPGVLTYEDATGYTWNRKDDHGTVVLTARAKPGFTLTGTTSWTFTAAQLAQLSGNQACPPAAIPPKVEGVKHTAPPAAPVVKGVKHEAAATLPRTGSESGLYGAAGLLLLMVGTGLVLVTRERSIEG